MTLEREVDCVLLNWTRTLLVEDVALPVDFPLHQELVVPHRPQDLHEKGCE